MIRPTFQRLSTRGACLLLVLSLPLQAWAQPVLEGIATNTSGGGSSITLDVPPNSAGGAAGDLLVAAVGVRINPSTAFPAGWTAVSGHGGFNQAICSTDDEGIVCQLAVFWKFSDGTETSVSVSFGAQVVRQAAGAVFRYSEVNTVSPIGPTATQNTPVGDMPTAPALVTTEDNLRVIQLVVSDTNGGSFPQLPLTGEPADAVFNLNSATPLTRDSIVMGGAEFLEPLMGSNTGDGVWTGGENNWRGSTITIRPLQDNIDADLAITKTATPAKVNPGGVINYTVIASNSAASSGDVSGAMVDDLFVAALDCSWTCTPSAGAACTAAGSGDISDLVDLPVAGSVTYSVSCTVDPGASGNVGNTASIVAPAGVTDTDVANNSDATVTIINQAPIALCQDVTVSADAQCQADASIDAGSNDPDNDQPVVIEENPPGPYPLGDTLVNLTITDGLGLSDSCSATVTVEDDSAPVISCNSPPTITPPDAPISFTATAVDNCGVEVVEITRFRCFQIKRNGKEIDKGESCIVSRDGAELIIDDVGGVNTIIEWQVNASDGSGNSSSETCSVEVVNPGHQP